MRKLILSLLLLASSSAILHAQQYDLVLEGGRVMDPETGLDAVRNVGIRDGKIVRISSEALSGRRRHPCQRTGGRSRIYRSPSAQSGPRKPARQGTRWRHHCTGAGDRRSRRRSVFESKRRPFADPLRYLGQPGGGAIARIRRPIAGGGHPARERTRHPATRHARTD